MTEPARHKTRPRLLRAGVLAMGAALLSTGCGGTTVVGQGAPPHPPTVVRPVQDMPACQVALPTPSAVVPILMYHLIRVDNNPRDPLGRALSVTPTDFAAQMAWLHDHGAHAVSLGAIRDSLRGGAPLPSSPVAITFDDGFADFLTAAVPVLRRYDFTATAFVVSGFTNHPGHLSIAQLRVASDAGMVIGAHSVNHPDLTTIPAAAATREIADSRTALQGWTGQAVDDFAYPSGRYDAAVEKQVAAAGFSGAVTTQIGVDHSLKDPFAWTRVRVSGGESLAGFARGLQVGLPGEPISGCDGTSGPGESGDRRII